MFTLAPGYDVLSLIPILIPFLSPFPCSQAFYQLCLDGDFNSSGNIFNCSDFVCSDSTSLSLADGKARAECYACYQPYSFICPLPLEILWYIIYWLFFILSW